MRLKQCVFYYCKVSGSNYGGAIYYDDTTSGGCEINSTCASYCSSDENHGEFAWIRTSASKNNYFLYSTLTQCANTQIGFCPVYSHFGYQCTKNNNAPYNYVWSQVPKLQHIILIFFQRIYVKEKIHPQSLRL